MPDPLTGSDQPLVLAIDQGTHSSRALVFDRQGRLKSSAAREIGLTHPQADWAEQDGMEVVASVRGAVEQCLAALGAAAAQVASAGLAIQRSSSICWDSATGVPLSPIISWQDRRTHLEVDRLAAQADSIHRRTGLFLSPHYGATKFGWCLEHLPEVQRASRERRLCWGPLASFVVYHLLRERPRMVDPQCASRTQLWSLDTRDWDPDLLRLFSVPPAVLPRCVPTCHQYGTLVAQGREIPLTAVNGDQSAALFAFGWPQEEVAYVNIGTGAFVQRALEHRPEYAPRLLTGIVLADGSSTVYMLEGNVNGAGTALTWLAEELHRDDLLARLPEWLARPEEPPLFLNGIGGLGGPFWQPEFQSRFIGTGDAWQRAVALVESIAFLLLANLEEMAKAVAPARRIRVSGGISRLDGLCQRLADLTGTPVQRREDPEATARGVAYLAAARPPGWNSATPEEQFLPRTNAALQARYRRWRDELARLTGM